MPEEIHKFLLVALRHQLVIERLKLSIAHAASACVSWVSTDVPPARDSDGRTRNPLYLGITLIYLGLSVAAGSLWAIVLVVPLLWVINVGVIAREERYLERNFGDAYRAYKARVRRWV